MECQTKSAPAYTSECISCALLLQTPSVPSGVHFRPLSQKQTQAEGTRTVAWIGNKNKTTFSITSLWWQGGEMLLAQSKALHRLAAGMDGLFVPSSVPHSHPGRGSSADTGSCSCWEHLPIHKHAEFNDIWQTCQKKATTTTKKAAFLDVLHV